MSAAAPVGPVRARAARILLALFGAAVAVDLVGLLLGATAVHQFAKPLLLSLLAAHVAVRGGPPLLVGAAVFGWGGDTLLLLDDDAAFMAGMGSFALGHLCYLVLFQRHGKAPARGGLLGAGYGIALVAVVVLLWPDLPADLRIPVAGYSLLLTAMAFRAGRLGVAAGLGGLLFLVSDTLIATGVAAWPQLPRPDFWVMSTYLAAQYLLIRGVVTASAPSGATGTTPPRPVTSESVPAQP